MLRSRTLVALALTGVLGVAGACKKPGHASQRSFDPGEIVSRHNGVLLELLHISYGKQRVHLRASLTNGSKVPVELAQVGILLRYEHLEYPLEESPEGLTDPIVVAPGASLDLPLRFRLGRTLYDEATLILRTAKRGDAWIEGLEVPVPSFVTAREPAKQAEKSP